MPKIRLMDRDLKANFEVRILNKETNKSKVISLYAEDETEETIQEKIKEEIQRWELETR